MNRRPIAGPGAFPKHHCTTPGALPHWTALGQLRRINSLIQFVAPGRQVEILGAQQWIHLNHVGEVVSAAKIDEVHIAAGSLRRGHHRQMSGDEPIDLH